MVEIVFALGEHRITDLRRRRIGLDANDIEAGRYTVYAQKPVLKQLISFQLDI
jgi:hypothetical protein